MTGTLEPILLYGISFFFFRLFRATPVVDGRFQARGQIGAEPASLHHSHSNVASEPRLQPTPQLAHGNAGSLAHRVMRRIEPATSCLPVGFVTAELPCELL